MNNINEKQSKFIGKILEEKDFKSIIDGYEDIKKLAKEKNEKAKKYMEYMNLERNWSKEQLE